MLKELFKFQNTVKNGGSSSNFLGKSPDRLLNLFNKPVDSFFQNQDPVSCYGKRIVRFHYSLKLPAVSVALAYGVPDGSSVPPFPREN